MHRQRARLMREFERASTRADAAQNWSRASTAELLLCVDRVEVQGCAPCDGPASQHVFTIAVFRADDRDATVYKTYADIAYATPTCHRRMHELPILRLPTDALPCLSPPCLS